MAADITNDRALGGNLRRSFRRKARTSPGKILRLRYLRTPTENAIRYPADMAILLQQDLANITPSPLAAFFEKSIGAARAGSVNCITTNAVPRFSLTDISVNSMFSS